MQLNLHNYFIGITVIAICIIPACATGVTAQQAEPARTVIPFNDQWKFRKGDTKKSVTLIKEQWRDVKIPHTWNAVDMQTTENFYQGDAFYKKTFIPLLSWLNKRVFIRFEGIGAVSAVYINEKLIGEHKGAYSAFCFEITHELNYGEVNSISVKANNASREDVIPINHNLFGVYGGMYRPVSLIITNKISFTNTDYASSGVYVRQQNVSSASAEITVTAKLENKLKEFKSLVLESSIYDAEGIVVSNIATPVKVKSQGLQVFQQKLFLKKPHLWDGLDDPYLYKIVTTLKENQVILDKVTLPLGIRKFEIVEGKGFFLNGRPYRLHGVNRHQDWLGYGSAVSNEQHTQDLAFIKEMGANTIRLSHYQHSEYFYAKADSIGFLIWAEIPFVNGVSGKEEENAKQQMTELIRQNYHHPSIYVWGLHNEVEGSSPDDYTGVLTATLNGLAKTEDPDRYTVSVNGYGEMERPENNLADIQGINRYFGWYEKTSADLENWVNEIEKSFPNYKVILSEYGCEGNVNQQDESPPANVNPTQGQFYPEQLETRLHEVQWGIIKRHPYLFATYLWVMFDFAIPGWNRGGVPARNQKGMVTFDRKIKKDVFFWYKANWSIEPVIYISDRRLVKRKNATTHITVYSNIGTPSLFVNGKQVGSPKQGTTSVHFIFENVELQRGKNDIKLAGNHEGKNLYDQVEWILE